MKKQIIFTALVALLAFTSSTISAQESDLGALREKALKRIGVLPAQMPGAENDTKLKQQLGEKLYFDVRLSKDDTISCNSCHLVDNNRAGDDGLPVSPGVGGVNGVRNSPTVLNAGFQSVQFWDGRAPDLKEQAKGPILNPVEMAMPDEKSVEDKISAIAEYQDMFKEVYPEEKNPITFDNIVDSIAAYERTLITKDRFDDFLKGENDALTEQELRGLNLFFTKGCDLCHNGPVLGGKGFYKWSPAKQYPDKVDLGRYDATKKDSDKYKFRVPMLRNVAITAPYFHDGKISKLEDAVDWMGYMRSKTGLTDKEKEDISAFLKTLTGKERNKSR